MVTFGLTSVIMTVVAVVGILSKCFQLVSSAESIIYIQKCCSENFELRNGICNPIRSTTDRTDNFVPARNKDFVIIPKHLVSSVFANRSDELRFGLIQKMPVCLKDSFIIDISLVNNTESAVNGLSYANFTPDGYLKHEHDYYSPSEYCINSFANDTMSLKVCKPECTAERPCIQKCCEVGEVWDLLDFEELGLITCKPSGEKEWNPTYYTDQYSKVSETGISSMKQTHYVSSHPKEWCTGSFLILSQKSFGEHEHLPFRVLKDGSVLQKVRRRKWQPIPIGNFCIDGAQNYPGEGESSEGSNYSRLYSGKESDTIIVDCRQFEELPAKNSTTLLYTSVMIISSVFLLLTASIYIILWKKQNIHGWTLLGHVISLLFQYIFLISAHLYQYEGPGCYFIAIGAHFFFLSTFTWLTMINFDVWWTFWTLNPTPARRSELKRFILYVVFAVGVPTIIVSVGLALEYTYGYDPESEVITPEYGRVRCFMDQQYAQLPYLYGPIAFLLSANLLFFGATVYSVYKNQELTSNSGLKHKKLQQKIRFFTKLFLVVGVTWIFEIVSWASTGENEEIPWYWVMFDIINILQAVAIFVIFVCNRETLYDLELKFSWFKKLCHIVTPVNQDTVQRRKSSHTQVSVMENNGLDNVELAGVNGTNH